MTPKPRFASAGATLDQVLTLSGQPWSKTTQDLAWGFHSWYPTFKTDVSMNFTLVLCEAREDVAQWLPGGNAHAACQRVDMRDHAVVPHVLAVANTCAQVRNGAPGDALVLKHLE